MPQNGKLYVFLHGLIALLERPDELTAAVIDMGNKHTYRAGHWLMELPVERGADVRLEGVRSGGAGVGETEEVYDKVVPRPFSPLIYARISLPKPQVPVKAFRRTEAQERFTGGSKAGPADVVAGLRVIEYEFDDVEQVRVRGIGWRAQVFSTELAIATLHIFAEPEVAMELGHHKDEFAAGAKLFEGLSTELLEVPKIRRLEDDYPEHVPQPEALTLLERQVLMRGVAGFYRLGTGLPAGSSFGGPGGELCGTRAARTGS